MMYSGLAPEKCNQSCQRTIERIGAERYIRNNLFVPPVIAKDIQRKTLPVSGDWRGYGYGDGDVELANTDRDLVVENH